jgi:hypothetical protein
LKNSTIRNIKYEEKEIGQIIEKFSKFKRSSAEGHQPNSNKYRLRWVNMKKNIFGSQTKTDSTK